MYKGKKMGLFKREGLGKNRSLTGGKGKTKKTGGCFYSLE